jgi:hypothetical protein
MMKKLFAMAFLAVLIFAAASPSQAQQKNWAIGLRLGEPTGLNVKKYIGKSNALDINVGTYGTFYGSRAYRNGYYRNAGLSIMINYLWQKRIRNADGLQWYYGLGGQLTTRKYYYQKSGNNDYYENNIGIGATGMIGIEYFIPNCPISLYADATPYLELFPSAFFLNLQAGIGGRVNF